MFNAPYVPKNVDQTDTWIVKKLCQTEHAVSGITLDNNGYVYYTSGENIFQIHGDYGGTEPQMIVNVEDADPRGIVWNNNILYVCDHLNHKILMYSLDTEILSTLAGNGKRGHTDGYIKYATFFRPKGIAVDKNGDLYITEDHCVRKINVSEGTVITVAGQIEHGLVNGSAKNAKFRCPDGIAVNEDGSIYVADTDNCCIRKIKDGVVSTVPFEGPRGSSALFVSASIQLQSPSGILLDEDGCLIVSDSVGLQKLNLRYQTAKKIQGAPQEPICCVAGRTRFYLGTFKSLLKLEQKNSTPEKDRFLPQDQYLAEKVQSMTKQLQDTQNKLKKIQDANLVLETKYDQICKDNKELQAHLRHNVIKATFATSATANLLICLLTT